MTDNERIARRFGFAPNSYLRYRIWPAFDTDDSLAVELLAKLPGTVCYVTDGFQFNPFQGYGKYPDWVIRLPQFAACIHAAALKIIEIEEVKPCEPKK